MAKANSSERRSKMGPTPSREPTPAARTGTSLVLPKNAVWVEPDGSGAGFIIGTDYVSTATRTKRDRQPE